MKILYICQMELKLNIGYQDLLALIRQLPSDLQTKLKADMAKLPKESKHISAGEGIAAIIKEMREQPLFKEIEDPVVWQKQQRDEWE